MLEPERRIGRYIVRRTLGEGATATVYEAYQPSLDRAVALKVLRGSLTGDAEFVERFSLEAKALARLDHPGIVRIYDAEQIEGQFVIAMQLVEGGSLFSKLRQLPPGELLAPALVQRMISYIAGALQYAHEFGVVHRDIKPSNILIARDGRPLVTDFGIAKLIGTSGYTRLESRIGTPEYMSPEQVSGAKVTERADLYALAVVAYELLTGRPPFAGENDLGVLHSQAYETPLAPSTLNPRLSTAVDAVFTRALAKLPEARHTSVPEFAADLAAALATVREAGPLTRVVPVVPPPPAPAPLMSPSGGTPKRRPLRAPIIASALVLTVAVGAAAFAVAQGGFGAALYTLGRATGLSTPSPSPVTAVHVAARLTDWIAEWNRAVARASDSEILKPAFDDFADITTLAVAAHQPIPSTVTQAMTELRDATTSLQASFLDTQAFDSGLHQQRVKALALSKELRALRTDYPAVPLANDVNVPAQRVFVSSREGLLPLANFPLTGYSITEEKQDGTRSWLREFRPINRGLSDFFWVAVSITVYSPSITPTIGKCSWIGDTQPTAQVEVAAVSLGEASRACKYTFATGARVFTLEVASRNVNVFAQDNPPSALTDGTAIDLLVSVARQEIQYLERLAPR